MKSTVLAAARPRSAARQTAGLAVAHEGRSRRLPRAAAMLESPVAERSDDTALRLVAARSGDHAAIHRLLLSIFHGPSAAEFQAQLDEPLYEPTDRLLVKTGDRLAAHLRITKRVIRFGDLTLPAAGFMDLGTSHEFRARGFASALIDAGQQQAIREGALLGVTRTTAPELFRRQGWSVCGRHSFSVASPRQILAHFCGAFPQDEPPACDDQTPPPIGDAADPPIVVRPLRRIELPAVIGLYEQQFGASYGALVRSDAWWDWLMARNAFDRAYVALAGGDHPELPELLASVIGACFVKEGRIVELLSLRGHQRVARRLVARVCGDAVERNLPRVRLDAAPHDSLHAHVALAGGETHLAATYQNETCMARIFDPLAMLERLSETLHSRARAAELPRPCSLGLDVFHHDAELTSSRPEDVRSYRLVIGQRGVKLVSGNPGRSYLTLRRRDLTPLLLGHWDVSEALRAGRIRASTRLAEDAAKILFPTLPWYRPALDDLMA